jgi:hypothetical protein
VAAKVGVLENNPRTMQSRINLMRHCNKMQPMEGKNPTKNTRGSPRWAPATDGLKSEN